MTAGFADSGKGRTPVTLVDTSVAIALVVEDHTAHRSTVSALSGRRLGLSGHAAFETFSVLTRLPSPARRTPAAAARLIDANFPKSEFLAEKKARELPTRLAGLNISGGSVYDALVAVAAEQSGLNLATRDHRAVATYRKFNLEIELLE